MKRFILVFLFTCSALFAFSNDFFRVKSNVINARSWASTSSNVVQTYKKGEVLSISEYHNAGYYKWGKVANTYPAQWVAISNLEKLSQEEINQYFKRKQDIPILPTKKKVVVTHALSYYIIIILKVLIAIYSIIFFILLYKEAKAREKEATHAAYGFCCFALLFWIFFPGKWQWLWVGFFWGGLVYPFAYAKFAERDVLYGTLIMIGAVLLSGISTWFFLRRWGLISDYVNYLNGWEVTGMIIGNLIVTNISGAVWIIDRCPLCLYFCATHEVDRAHEGTSYYDVVRTETNEYWDHRDVEEDYNNNKIKVTDYYIREKFRTTSTYRKDHYLSTYYCPHCHGRYQSRYSMDKLVHRETRRV